MERQYLRAQVRVLEAELERLKRAVASETPHTGTSAASSDHKRNNQASIAWKGIIRRQQAARQHAETENVRLRAHLARQFNAAKYYQKQMVKRGKELLQEFECRNALYTERLLNDDQQRFCEELRSRMGHHTASIDQVILSRDCDAGQSMGGENRVSFLPVLKNNELCFEATYCTLHPFELNVVVQSIWNVITSENVDVPNGFFGAVRVPNQTSEIEFLIKGQMSCRRVTIERWSLGQRVHQDQGAALVWESRGRTDSAVMDGKRLELVEHAYASFESAGSGISTEVRLCWRFFLSMESENINRWREPVTQLFQNFLKSSFRDHIACLHHAAIRRRFAWLPRPTRRAQG